jgi:hypothetical protein
MSVSLQISLDSETAARLLQRVRAGGADLAPLQARTALQAKNFSGDHLRKIAGTRHRTAERLGAAPTGHLSLASRRIESTSSRDFAELRFPADTGLGRAFRDMNIVPKKVGGWLTIPVHAAAYGKRAQEFPNLVCYPLGPRKTLVLATKVENGIGEVFYVLAKKAKVKQDRDLLPSDEEYRELARRVAVAWLAELETEGGAAA